MICTRGGSAPRRLLPLKTCGRSSELLPFLDPVTPFRIDDRNEPDDTAITALPVPWEQRESAAPAGDLVDVAADVLDPQYAVLEQDAVDRLPVWEIFLPV